MVESSARPSADDALRSFPPLSSSETTRFYKPPVGVDYDDNPTIFGKILRGKAPALALDETENLLVIHDRTPRAPLHGLVIPKRHIRTINNLRSSDEDLLREMRVRSQELLKAYHPEALENNDFILCFHVPPFNTVNHLHLHVLAPASEMSLLMRYGKYMMETPWCASLERIEERLARG